MKAWEAKHSGLVLATASAVFAAEAHVGQVRKELNEPYINHPLRVGSMAARLGMSPEFIAAAHLHDVVEDTKIPMTTIERLFPSFTVDLVKAMTKWWESGLPASVVIANKDAYYNNLLRTPDAALLKVLDRIDNIRDLTKVASRVPSAHGWAKKYYSKTLAEFSPLLSALAIDETAAGATALKWFHQAIQGLEVVL